jgi:hypothetical protein
MKQDRIERRTLQSKKQGQEDKKAYLLLYIAQPRIEQRPQLNHTGIQWAEYGACMVRATGPSCALSIDH